MLKVLVFTPAGLNDPALAIAATRAGHTGVFNLELSGRTDPWAEGLDRLARLTQGGWGLALSDVDLALDLAGSYGPRGLGLVVVPAAAALAAPEAVNAIRAVGVQVLLEAIEWDRRLAGPIAADGIILKGHESGGRVGEATSFILLQQAMAAAPLGPVIVRGGVGLRSAGALRAGGAAGIVLDDQCLMLAESSLAGRMGPVLSRFTGAETILVEEESGGAQWRGIEKPGSKAGAALRRTLGLADAKDKTALARSNFGWGEGQIAPIGQAATFAPAMAANYGNVAKLARALVEGAEAAVALAAARPVWAEGQGVAQAHGTRWPIVQGPMTRVSDTASFAQAVAAGGGLPMLALALMRPDAVDRLLEDTKTRLAGQPWGVGLLGFAPSSLIKDQVAVALKHGPSFALIAGGRPDQARAMEDDGVPSYLHVPSPRLLKMFLEQGAKRFVFEGRECGGHVGPMSSMVLWDSMVGALLDEVKTEEQGKGLCVLFAGGIHDAASAAMVACLAAPLAERGIACGVLMGTAYLFTREAVESGTIVEGFQKVMLDCDRTVTLETGPGHASRAAMSAFAEEFAGERRRLEAEGVSAEDQREKLEDLTLGRLRLASKATERQGDVLKSVAVRRQKAEGMYMTGQVAMLRDKVTTVADLHAEIGTGAAERLAAAVGEPEVRTPEVKPKPVDIAIVGLSALLPGAEDYRQYWENLLDGVNAISEIPAHRWDWRIYFDADPTARDKIYSKWGGFLKDMPFDPMRYGIPPRAIPALDPLQLMTLEVARRCLEDAGYTGDEAGPKAQRLKSSIILGASGGAGDVGAQYAVRSEMPRFLGELDAEAAKHLPEWTEDSFAGILLNVAAGRAANRLDFGGVNYTVDAACASSLSAVYQAVLELETGRSDLVLAGGIDTVQGPFGYLCFSKTRALSPRGQCSTFQETADGIVISEGLAMVALKRLADAERDGDKVYAVIKGVGGSSDGKAKSMTAPHPDGQIRALGRAYDMAGYSPATVGLFEAHGTGTVAGDTSEMTTVTRLLKQSGADPKQAAIGSVKTLIGHTKAAAGIAGLIKATLAVHHAVLPPHGRKAAPNARLREADIPLYVADKPRPWISRDVPRRAGISAFGFGGTNFHVTIEEAPLQRAIPSLQPPARARWKEELLVWRGGSRADIAAQVQALAARVASGFSPDLADLALTLAHKAPARGLVAALVVSRSEDLGARLSALAAHLGEGKPLPPAAAFSEAPALAEGKLALIFPGQGSQYPEMMADVAVLFPEMAEAMAEADAVLGFPLSRSILPAGAYDEPALAEAAAALTRTDVAQPALGAIEAGLWAVLRSMGVRPAMAAGHSYGEFAALHAAGVMSQADLFRVSRARGRFMVEAAEGGDLGTMAAGRGPREKIEALIQGIEGVLVANHNAPEQSILSGSRAGIVEAIKRGEAAGISVKPIQVGAAFHSPIVAPAEARLADFIAGMTLKTPDFAVYSNTTAAEYPADPAAIGPQLARQLSRPVEFVAEVQAMAAAGARVFLSVGPKSAHATMVRQILGDRARAITTDDEAGGLRGLLAALGALLAEGAALDLTRLWAGRGCKTVALEGPLPVEPPLGKHMWLLNGSGARPAGAPLPHVLTVEEIAARGPKAPAAAVSVPMAQAGTTPPQAAAIHQPARGSMTPAPRVQRMERPRMDLSPQDSASPVYGSAADLALAEFQATMARFLETQERVMLAYLGGAPAAPALPRAAVARPVAAAPAPRPAPMPIPAPVVAAPAPAPVAPAPVAAPAPTPAPVAATAVPAAAPAPAPAAAKGLDKDGITKLLLGIVEDRTGYPGDMLGMDQSIEADLGIDSIKRVEIIGALIKGLPGGQAAAAQPISESLNEQKTLGGIVDKLSRHLEAAGPFDPAGVDNAVPKMSARPPRFVMRAEVAGPAPAPALPKGRYLIVSAPDARAEALKLRIEAAGGEAVIAAPDHADTIAGPFIGLVHFGAAGLSAVTLSDTDGWFAAVEASERSAYRLARAHAETLKVGRVVLVSATGGSFGRDGRAAGLIVGGGGPGLAKSLREEWDGVTAKAVDLDPAQPADAQAGQVFAELAGGGRIEVGYPAGRRTIFRATEVNLDGPPRAIPDGAVILATGGARGITAEVLRPFARPGITLVLIGRSALPAPESAALAAAQDIGSLRKHLLAEAKARGETVTPAALERAIGGIQRDREIRANIADLTAAGAVVEYHTADMADPAQVAAAMATILAQHPCIHGVIHGAGVIEDKRITDKQPDSWDRVVLPKVVGALSLARALDAARPVFFAMFASVAGRFGNSGQTDYAAANEVMNRMAAGLHNAWPDTRVVAVNWGPWDATSHGAGMVSDAVRLKFEAQGVTLVDARGGAEAFHDEMLRGPMDVTDVVLGAGPWDRHETDRGAERSSGLPLLPAPVQELGARGGIKVARVLGLGTDPWLGEHRIGGVPVLPLACATELCAEAAAFIWDDWQVTALSDLRALAGLRLEDDADRAVELLGMGSEHADATGFFARVELRGTGEKARAHYRASVQMLPKGASVPVDEEALAVAWELLRFKPAPHAWSAREIYRDKLFHGPSFQLMKAVEGMDSRGLAIAVSDSRPGSFGPDGWFFDPGLLDTAAQLAWVWSLAERGAPALPNAIGRAVRLGRGQAARMVLRLRPESVAPQVLADVVVADAAGSPILLIEALEATSDAGLMRFCGWSGAILPDVAGTRAEAAE